jgi:hypothetical protein
LVPDVVSEKLLHLTEKNYTVAGDIEMFESEKVIIVMLAGNTAFLLFVPVFL